MTNQKQQLRQVITDSREKDISYAMFRNAIGKKLGLYGMDFIGLSLIFARGSVAPSDLTRYTGLSPGSTSAMLDRLEASGLAVRRPNPNDRRAVLVTLARDAEEKIAPLFEPARVAQEKLLEGYSEDELRLLSDYFRKSATAFETERKKLSESRPSS